MGILIDAQWYIIIVLICISQIIYAVEPLLICLFAIYISSLVRFVLGLLIHFIWIFSLVLSFKCSLLYYLDNSPLSDMSFVNIFSQHVVCFVILLTMSFLNYEFLIIRKYTLSILYFMAYALVLYLKSYCHTMIILFFSLMLSSRNLIVLYFAFRSVTHFK